MEEIRRELYTEGSGIHIRETAKENGEGEDSGRTIEGYAIRFETPSAVLYEDDETSIREVIAREAVTADLLERSDIKFTLFHDNQLLLARSKQGKGTLTTEIREEGVWFSFEAPRTADGDKAVELVRAGIIDGCSFAFSTCYRDKGHVERTTTERGGKRETVCRVKKITGIYDMTLTPDPAYPSTSVESRALLAGVPAAEDYEAQVREMREAGSFRL